MPANYDHIPPHRRNEYEQNAEAAVNEAAADMVAGFDNEPLGLLNPKTMDLGKAAVAGPDWFTEEKGKREVVEGAEWLLKQDASNTDRAASTVKAAEDFANTYDTADVDIMEMTKWEQLRPDLMTTSKSMNADFYRSLDTKASYGVKRDKVGPLQPPTQEEMAKQAAENAAMLRKLSLESKWRTQSPAPIEPSADDRRDDSI